MKIFIMNAPVGYKCIGNVAINSVTVDAMPDKNLYRYNKMMIYFFY